MGEWPAVLGRCPFRGCPMRWADGVDRLCQPHAGEVGPWFARAWAGDPAESVEAAWASRGRVVQAGGCGWAFALAGRCCGWLSRTLAISAGLV